MQLKKACVLLIVCLMAISFLALALPVQAVTSYSVTFAEGTGGTISWAPYWNNLIGLTYWAGTYTINNGTPIQIMAHPNVGYDFANFTVTESPVANGSTTLNPITQLITNGFTITANFISTSNSNTTHLTLLNNVGGLIVMYYTNNYTLGVGGYYAGTYDIVNGSEVTLSTTPITGYSFERFEVLSTTGDSLATVTTEPFVFTVSDNCVIIPYFILTPTPTPTPSPSGFNFVALRVDVTALIETVIGAVLCFASMALFIRASGAWVLGVIALIASFTIIMIAQPFVSGLMVFALDTILSAVFLFNGAGKRSK